MIEVQAFKFGWIGCLVMSRRVYFSVDKERRTLFYPLFVLSLKTISQSVLICVDIGAEHRRVVVVCFLAPVAVFPPSL